MYNKTYKNFVKANSPEVQSIAFVARNGESVLSGTEASRIYLEEVKDARSNPKPNTGNHYTLQKRKKALEELPVTNKDIFVIVQNNDIDKLKCILDNDKEKVHIVDDFGWSLLMIACQANSVDVAKELLRRNIDISIRDKAGNSARSLVIKNRNYALADVLLQYRELDSETEPTRDRSKNKLLEPYMCEICNKSYPDKEEHLSSTLHNFGASKIKKIPANYIIPSSNIGYQLMLKGGWDRDSGLGRDGSGRKYPIKPIQKKDRKGLGHKKAVFQDKPREDNIKQKARKMFADTYKNNRQFEINFRQQFY